MPHQCVRCSRVIAAGSKELLEGCQDCGSHFFFYIKDEQLKQIKANPIIIPEEDKNTIEKDIRELAGIVDEQAPVILDIESVRATGSGKFELDLAKIFRRDLPLVYKLEEGKYIIDLASTLRHDIKDIKEIQDPNKKDKE